MKRKILLVDDEVAVLLTLKAVLEISGFEVDSAASAKDAKSKLKKNEYAMVITDMRMESDAAGAEVIQAARSAEYYPALALLTAFPVGDEDWQEIENDNVKVLMKPMQTKMLLQQIEGLFVAHEARKASKPKSGGTKSEDKVSADTKTSAKKVSVKKTASTKVAAKKR